MSTLTEKVSKDLNRIEPKVREEVGRWLATNEKHGVEITDFEFADNPITQMVLFQMRREGDSLYTFTNVVLTKETPLGLYRIRQVHPLAIQNVGQQMGLVRRQDGLREMGEENNYYFAALLLMVAGMVDGLEPEEYHPLFGQAFLSLRSWIDGE